MILHAILLAAMLQATGVAPAKPGFLVGCVTANGNQAIPGAHLTALSGAVRHTTVADGSGCYRFELPPATYRLTFRVVGFDNVTHNRVIVSSGRETRVDIQSRLSGICKCIWQKKTLAQQWTAASAVLDVRLDTPADAPPIATGSYEYVGTVLEDLKPASDAASRPRTVVIAQNQTSGSPEPFADGQEVVVFLASWNAKFVIVNDDPGLAIPRGAYYEGLVFPIKNRRIDSAPQAQSQYAGLPLDRFLGELRTYARDPDLALQTSAWPEEAKLKDVEVRLAYTSHGGCIGRCIRYLVTVGGDGTVEYNDVGDEPRDEPRRRTIPVDDVVSVIDGFVRAHFFAAPDSYESQDIAVRDGDAVRLATASSADGPEWILTLRIGARLKNVRLHAGFPVELAQLRDLIEQIGGPAAWTAR